MRRAKKNKIYTVCGLNSETSRSPPRAMLLTSVLQQGFHCYLPKRFPHAAHHISIRLFFFSGTSLHPSLSLFNFSPISAFLHIFLPHAQMSYSKSQRCPWYKCANRSLVTICYTLSSLAQVFNFVVCADNWQTVRTHLVGSSHAE